MSSNADKDGEANETGPERPALARVLGFWTLTFYGVSVIIGAGVYVALGEVIARAGSAAPLSFLLAGAAAAPAAQSSGGMLALALTMLPASIKPYVQAATAAFSMAKEIAFDTALFVAALVLTGTWLSD